MVPCDLVIDHSVQVDHYGTANAFRQNVALEFDRNAERYQLLKFAQRAFDEFRVVPPGTGIVHQVNLEYLAPVVQLRDQFGELTAYPDTLVGTDSHTTMINGLGVLGWGVGGIEAEAVMLGQPYFMLIPDVVGMKLIGDCRWAPPPPTWSSGHPDAPEARAWSTSSSSSTVPASPASAWPTGPPSRNMAPEYGATMGFFPVDDETLRYLRAHRPRSGRGRPGQALLQGSRASSAPTRPPTRSSPPRLTLDLSTVVPSLAGPRRPQDLVPLRRAQEELRGLLPGLMPPAAPAARRSWPRHELFHLDRRGRLQARHGGGRPGPPRRWWRGRTVPVSWNGEEFELRDGSVVIAAITSCTNTSNPSVMIGAGLLAKKAVERGLKSRPWVKTSMAPGSRVVTDYLRRPGSMPYLDQLGFQTGGVRLHHLHRQQRPARRSRSPRRSRATTW